LGRRLDQLDFRPKGKCVCGAMKKSAGPREETSLREVSVGTQAKNRG